MAETIAVTVRLFASLREAAGPGPAPVGDRPHPGGGRPRHARDPALVSASARFLASAYAGDGRWGVQSLREFKGLGDLLWRAGILKDRDGRPIPRPDFLSYFTNALLPPAGPPPQSRR